MNSRLFGLGTTDPRLLEADLDRPIVPVDRMGRFVQREVIGRPKDVLGREVALFRGEKVYLSGPMSGLPDHNRPAFHQAACLLSILGLRVVNPATFSDDGLTWEEMLRGDLVVMLALCTKVIVLPGYEKSNGSTLEINVAGKVGMPVLPLESLEALVPEVS